ncbi:MAG: hypothetical protein ACK56F_10165, partial [bacterium]
MRRIDGSLLPRNAQSAQEVAIAQKGQGRRPRDRTMADQGQQSQRRKERVGLRSRQDPRKLIEPLSHYQKFHEKQKHGAL